MRSGAISASEVDKKVHREFPHWFRNLGSVHDTIGD